MLTLNAIVPYMCNCTYIQLFCVDIQEPDGSSLEPCEHEN